MKFDPVLMDLPEEGREYPSALIPMTFKSGGCDLLARILVASGKGPHPVAILMHGFPGNEPNFDVAHALRRSGWNVLYFHYRGAWGTGGDFSFGRAIEDGQAAVEFVSSDRAKEEFRCDPSKILVIGHSMGGFVALHTAARDSRVSGAALIAAFNVGAFGKWVAERPEKHDQAVQLFGKNILPIRGATPESLVTEAVAQHSEFDMESLADQVKKTPLLIQYGIHDTVSVPEVHHHSLLRALKAKGRTAPIEERAFNCDHMFIQTRISLCREITTWAAGFRPEKS